MARIFISYSRSDKSIVDGMIRQLEAAGHPVWVDRTGIRGGEQWRKEIVEAIEANDVFLLILSKNSTDSDNVRAEIDLAKESKKKIIPVSLQQVTIPSTMKYQLAGLHRIHMYPDHEAGFQELLAALNEDQAAVLLPAEKSSEQYPSKARNKRVTIGGIVALAILLPALGFLFLNNPDGSAGQSPTPTHPAEEQASTEDLITSAELSETAVMEQPSLDEPTTFEELEPLLLQANIRLSEPEDYERTRGYFWGPDAAYFMLAVASLQVIGEQRFIQYINMDIVEKWYTEAEGSGYADRGPLDLEIVEESLIKAHNDYWGDAATSLEGLLEPLD